MPVPAPSCTSRNCANEISHKVLGNFYFLHMTRTLPFAAGQCQGVALLLARWIRVRAWVAVLGTRGVASFCALPSTVSAS